MTPDLAHVIAERPDHELAYMASHDPRPDVRTMAREVLRARMLTHARSRIDA